MTESDWHDVGVVTLEELGRRVKAARLRRGWSKERAAREADISAITWKRVEDGLGVQDAKRAAILDTLGLDDRGETYEEAVGPYVAAVGTAVEQDSPDDVARAMRDMAEAIREMSERLDRLEGRSAG